MKRKLALGLILTTMLSINTVSVFANERVEQISGNVFSIIQPRLSIIDEIGLDYIYRTNVTKSYKCENCGYGMDVDDYTSREVCKGTYS